VWLGETLIPAPARLYRVERKSPNLKLFKTKHLNKTTTYRSKHYYAGATKVRMETYDAAGTTLVKAYDYLSGMVYLTAPLSSGEGPGVRSELDFIASSEGRAILTKKVLNLTTDPTTGDKFRFEYSLKDHLGNLRVSCRCGEPKRDAQGVIIPEGQPGAGIEPLAVVQEQHYSLSREVRFGNAWGLAFTSTSSVTADRFTYNSKELLTDLDLGWNDYGFRMYDASVGRWSAVDLLSEFSYSITGYRYGFNNPLRFTDFLGLWEKTDKGYSTSDKDEIARFLTLKEVDKDQSIENISNFVEGEMKGGGTLSDGSRVLTGIDITVKYTKNGIQFNSDKSTINRTWHEVQGSLTPKALDPRTINQNILGYTYPGPNNPKNYNGDDDYSYIPINPIEIPGLIHDLAYDRKRARGASGLITNTKVIEDDFRFVYQHYALANNKNLSLKTRFHSYILGRGLHMLATPKMILQEIKRELIIVGESVSKIQN
jgi:RHS repeat-associated protein